MVTCTWCNASSQTINRHGINLPCLPLMHLCIQACAMTEASSMMQSCGVSPAESALRQGQPDSTHRRSLHCPCMVLRPHSGTCQQKEATAAAAQSRVQHNASHADTVMSAISGHLHRICDAARAPASPTLDTVNLLLCIIKHIDNHL